MIAQQMSSNEWHVCAQSMNEITALTWFFETMLKGGSVQTHKLLSEKQREVVAIDWFFKTMRWGEATEAAEAAEAEAKAAAAALRAAQIPAGTLDQSLTVLVEGNDRCDTARSDG